MKVKLLQPKLFTSPFSFFFRFFIGTKKVKIKTNTFDENFEFELRQAYTQYCTAVKIVPETVYYEITKGPTKANIHQWSYLKGVISLDGKGHTTCTLPFKFNGKYGTLKFKNKKSQILIGEENLDIESQGKNIYFNLHYHKNPKSKKHKLLIDLSSGS
jgi:hypothetical protein|tara:strand:+ start:77 stop:550 length:474 start_codon:yes stop_codon:yes gene_type:complete